VRNDTEHALIFANLVDFDQTWGHRRDPENFARALEEFDQQLGGLLRELRNDDLLIITADHGCDPTFEKHTDHTREYVPLLVYGDHVKAGVDLGTRETFADVASMLAEVFGLEHEFAGRSFLEDLESS
jgi:phosphopentomutase